jgi:hypothetical protein
MKSIRSASVLAMSALLVACGGDGGADPKAAGGGGSGSNSGAATATTTLVASTVRGLDITNLASTSTPFIAALVAETPTFSNIKSLSNFTLNDEAGSRGSLYEINTTGMSAGTFYKATANLQATSFSVGGTTWPYSRFGLFSSTGTRTPLPPVQGTYTRHTPFFMANVSSPATLADAIYANGLAVGTLAFGGDTTIQCEASAAYTHSSQSIELTLSNCYSWPSSGLPTELPVTGTISMNSKGATSKNFSFNKTEVLVVESSGYKLAGPTGQELVGAVTGSGPRGYFTFAFGAKK